MRAAWRARRICGVRVRSERQCRMSRRAWRARRARYASQCSCGSELLQPAPHFAFLDLDRAAELFEHAIAGVLARGFHDKVAQHGRSAALQSLGAAIDVLHCAFVQGIAAFANWHCSYLQVRTM